MFSEIYQNFVKWDKYGERYPTWGSTVSSLSNDAVDAMFSAWGIIMKDSQSVDISITRSQTELGLILSLLLQEKSY